MAGRKKLVGGEDSWKMLELYVKHDTQFCVKGWSATDWTTVITGGKDKSHLFKNLHL